MRKFSDFISVPNSAHYLNLFKLNVVGIRPYEFIREVLQNPFESKENQQLRRQYELLGQYRRHLLLSNDERIILNFLLQKEDFASAVSELPHLFYHVARLNKRVYSFPSADGLQPFDCKSGDLFIPENPGVFIECKTWDKFIALKVDDTIC